VAGGVQELILVRHGESVGNVARERSEAAGAEEIDIDRRDPDVPLSELGREQAAAVGRWWAGLAADRRPDVVWSSPYVRALETLTVAMDAAKVTHTPRVDERLRDRELGILDRLTGRGVRSRYPDEAVRRRYLGKLYYRPPGGESWADVALRLRSLLADVLGPDGDRALLVCHDAVILLVRYVLENLDEARLMELAAEESVGNAAVSRFVRDGSGRWTTVEYNSVEHLHQHGATPTTHGRENHAATE
jgi:broad specificity phosphatase PhoE